MYGIQYYSFDYQNKTVALVFEKIQRFLVWKGIVFIVTSIRVKFHVIRVNFTWLWMKTYCNACFFLFINKITVHSNLKLTRSNFVFLRIESASPNWFVCRPNKNNYFFNEMDFVLGEGTAIDVCVFCIRMLTIKAWFEPIFLRNFLFRLNCNLNYGIRSKFRYRKCKKSINWKRPFSV